MTPYSQTDFGHTPFDAAFSRGDVYDIGHRPERAAKRPLTVAIAGCGGVAQAKWIPAIRRLQTINEPVSLAGLADPDGASRQKASGLCGAPAFVSLGVMLADAASGRDGAAAVALIEATHRLLDRSAEIDLSREGLLP